jgi:hypothetical protein
LIVTTTKGSMDSSQLDHRAGVEENETERVEWSEYWLLDECVHRSVRLTLKKYTVTGEATAASL